VSLVERFAVEFGVWEEALPHVHLMFSELEMQLIVAMQGQPVDTRQASELLDIPLADANQLLRQAYARHVVDRASEKEDTRFYAPGTFYTRLDHFAKYEGWDEIPAPDRRTINRRFLNEFIARHRPSVMRKMAGLEAENALPNDTVLLLREVEEMLDSASHIVVQPCDCRRLGQMCQRPVETCIWLDDGALEAMDRGYGRPLSREEAKELVRRADKAGLMHTADSEWRTRGLHAICNCCACDCYPFRAAHELGSKGIWPRSRYVAVHHREECNLCGACVKRCPFAAFFHDGIQVEQDGKLKDNVQLDASLCWGCGLCANSCPCEAIEMRALDQEQVSA
jgi:Pyruvate/2-oxoacid:ferredoxin oxidoreductase delta subunit